MSTSFCCTICIWISLQLIVFCPRTIDCVTESLHVILNQSECENKFYLHLKDSKSIFRCPAVILNGNKNRNYCSAKDRNKVFLEDSVTVTYMNYKNLEHKTCYPETCNDCKTNCEDLEYRNNNSKLINRNSLKTIAVEKSITSQAVHSRIIGSLRKSNNSTTVEFSKKLFLYSIKNLNIFKDLAYREQKFIKKLTFNNYVNCCIWQQQSSNGTFFAQNEESNVQEFNCSILIFNGRIFLIRVRNLRSYGKSIKILLWNRNLKFCIKNCKNTIYAIIFSENCLPVCPKAKEAYVFINEKRKVKKRENHATLAENIKPIDQRQRRLTKPQEKKYETSSILAATSQGRSDKKTSIHGFSSVSRDFLFFHKLVKVTVFGKKIQTAIIKLNRMTALSTEQVFTDFTREMLTGDRRKRLIYLDDLFCVPKKEVAMKKKLNIRNYENNHIYKYLCTLSSFMKNNRYYEKQNEINKPAETSFFQNKHRISNTFAKNQNIGKLRGQKYLCSIADSNNLDIKRFKKRMLLSSDDKFKAKVYRDVDLHNRHYTNRKRRTKDKANIKLHLHNYNKDKISQDFLAKNAELQDFPRVTATKNFTAPSSYSAEKEKSGTLTSNSMKNPSNLSFSADTGEDYQQQIDHRIAKDFGEITDILRAEKNAASPPRKVANCRGAADVASSARPPRWSSSGAKNNRQSVSREFRAGPPFPPRLLRPRNFRGAIGRIDTREPAIITMNRDSRQRQQVIRPAPVRKSADSEEIGANVQRLAAPRAKLDLAMGELESTTRDEAKRNITAAATQPGDTKKLVAEALIISRLADGRAKPLSLLLLAPMSNDSAVEHYSYESETFKLNELFSGVKDAAKMMGVSNDISESKFDKLKEENLSRKNVASNEDSRNQESIDEGIELENELKQLKSIRSNSINKVRFVDRNKSERKSLKFYNNNSAFSKVNNLRITKEDAESIIKDGDVKKDESSSKLLDKLEVILKNSEIAVKNKKLLPVSNHSKLQVTSNNEDNKLFIHDNLRSKHLIDDNLGHSRTNDSLSNFKKVSKNSLLENNKITSVVKSSKRKCRSKVKKLSSNKKVAKRSRKNSKVSQQKLLPLIDNSLLQYMDHKNLNNNNQQKIRQAIGTGRKSSLSEMDKAYYDDYYNYQSIETPIDYIDENKSVKVSPIRRKLLSLESFEYDEESATVTDGESNYDYEEKFHGDSRYEKAESQLHHFSIELRNAALPKIAKAAETDLKPESASRNFNKSIAFDPTYYETTYNKIYQKIKPSNKDFEVKFLKRSLKSIPRKKKRKRLPKKNQLYVSSDLVGYNYQPKQEKSNIRRERKADEDGEKRLRPLLEPGQEYEISVRGKLKMHLDDSDSDNNSDSSDRRKRYSASTKTKSRKVETEQKLENTDGYPTELHLRRNRRGNSTTTTANPKARNPLQKIGDFFKKKFAGSSKPRKKVCRKKIHAKVKITPVKPVPPSDHHSEGGENPAGEDDQSTLSLPANDLPTTTTDTTTSMSSASSSSKDFTPTQTPMSSSSSSPHCKCETTRETNIVFTSTAMNTIEPDHERTTLGDETVVTTESKGDTTATSIDGYTTLEPMMTTEGTLMPDQTMMTTNGLAPEGATMTTSGLTSETATMTTDGLAPEGVTMTDDLTPEGTTMPSDDTVPEGTTVSVENAGPKGTTVATSNSNNSSDTNLQGMLDILNFIKKLEKFIDEKGPLKIGDENGSIEIKLQKIFIRPGKNQSIPVLEDRSRLQGTNDLSFKVDNSDLIHQANNVGSISPQKKKSESTATDLEAPPAGEDENLGGTGRAGNSNSASTEEANVVPKKQKAYDYEAMKGYIENPIPNALFPTKNRLYSGDFAAKQRLDEPRIGAASGVNDHPSSSPERKKKSPREKRRGTRKKKKKKKRRKGNRTRIGGKKARQLQRRQNDFAFARASRASEKRRRDKSSARQEQRHRVRRKKRRRMLAPAAAEAWLY